MIGEECKSETVSASLFSEYKQYLQRKRERIFAQNQDELVPIFNKQRRYSKEELESVKSSLKPVYSSFPRLKHHFIPKFNSPFLSPFQYGQQDPSEITIDSMLSFQSSIFVTSNYFIGLGILIFPFIYSTTGLLGLIQILVVGLICAHTAKLLQRIQYTYALESYADIAECSLGYIWRVILSYLFYFQLLFDCTFNMMIFLNSMIALFQDQPHLKEPIEAASVLVFIAIIQAVAYKPYTKKVLSFFSIVGSLSALCLSIFLFIAFFEDLKYISSQSKKVSKKKKPEHLSNAINLVSAFGLTVSLFMIHTASPNIFRSMQVPSKFPSVINTTFSLAILYYTLFTLTAYLTYGNTVEENVINSIGANPDIHWIIIALIHITLIFMVLSRFAMISFPLLQNIEDILTTLFHLRAHVDSSDVQKSVHTDLASRFSIIQHSRLSLTDANSPNTRLSLTDAISPNDHASANLATPTSPVYSAIINIVKAGLPILCYYLVTSVFKGKIVLLLKIIGGIFGVSLSICFPILFYTLIFWRSISIFEKLSLWGVIIVVFYLGIMSIIIELDQTNMTTIFTSRQHHQDCLRH